MSDKDRQQDEIEVLESIYPQELIVASKFPAAGCFKISPGFRREEMIVRIVAVISGKSEERVLKVKYLPPIELYFMCPLDYPSNSEPLFMLHCPWLPDKTLTKICHKLDELWDNSKWEILFTWASFLIEDCCSFLDVEELKITLNMDRIKQQSLDTKNIDFDAENSLNEINVMNQKNIKLRELANKKIVKETRSDVKMIEDNIAHKKMKKYKNFKKNCKYKIDQENCFKYETPKDVEKKERVSNRLQSSSEQSCLKSNSEKDNTPSKPLTKIESILKVIHTYGKRCKPYMEEFDSRSLPNTTEIRNVVNQIVEYNDHRLDVEFRSSSHCCNICFDTKPPASCVCIKPCRHAFCKDCIREYLTVNIRDNQVQTLCCLDPKCDTVLNVYQIKQNVDGATFEKYRQFTLNMVVQNDPKLTYCPRKFCQGVARLSDLGQEMCHCEQCGFYFCSYCNKSYHGVEMCKVKSEERTKVIQEYQTASVARKAELEKRFTKQQLMKWVEDDLTEKLLKECSKPCPNCGAHIEKDSGCNKMICINCHIPYCWLCNTCLSSTNPYAHYQIKGSPCYEKLFPFIFDEVDNMELFEFEDDFDDRFIYFEDYDEY